MNFELLVFAPHLKYTNELQESIYNFNNSKFCYSIIITCTQYGQRKLIFFLQIS